MLRRGDGGGPEMRLAPRLFLTLGASVAIAVVGVTLLLGIVARNLARRAVEDQLDAAFRVFTAVADEREGHFAEEARAEIDSVRTHARLEAFLEGDDVSFLEILEEWAAPRDGRPYDLAAIYDGRRVLRAAVARPEFAEVEAGSLRTFDRFSWRIAVFAEPLESPGPLRHALDHVVGALRPGEDMARRFVLDGPVPCGVTAFRVGSARRTLGAVVFARSLRREDFDLVKSMAQVDVGLASQGKLLLSTFEAERHAMLEKALPFPLGAEPRNVEVDLGGAPFAVFLRPAPPDPDGNTPVRLFAVSLAAARELQSTGRWGALAIGLATIGLMLVIGRGLARSLARPVVTLARATERVARGELGAVVAESGPTEVRELSRAFNEMTRGLAEKERVRAVLDKVVSREIAEELLAKGVELGGEVRRVTVLFSDIRGFTPVAEKLEPPDVVLLLNDVHSRATAAIEREMGVLDKYLGDGAMALFGAPNTLDGHPARAVRAALDIQAAIADMNARRRERGEAAIEVGIGIHTGPVVCGNIGSKDRLSYTAVGSVVNVASRLCGAAEAGSVLVSLATFLDLPAGTRATKLESIVLKGISEPVTAYRVDGVGA